MKKVFYVKETIEKLNGILESKTRSQLYYGELPQANELVSIKTYDELVAYAKENCCCLKYTETVKHKVKLIVDPTWNCWTLTEKNFEDYEKASYYLEQKPTVREVIDTLKIDDFADWCLDNNLLMKGIKK